MRCIWKKFKRCCSKIWEVTRPARRWIAKGVRKCAKVIAEECVRQFVGDVWDTAAA